jgi:carotenoid cleavage dioxygenase
VENVIGETRLLKHDVVTGLRQVHDFGPGHLPGEFLFVPRAADADEDDGCLMGLVVDVPSDTTRLVILNACDFEGDPVASILLPHRVPPGFHGNWVPAA